MKDEAQRIAIAEACGWTQKPWNKDSRGRPMVLPELKWFHPTDPYYSKWPSDNPPNYLSDLNAMHEAEKVLTEEQQHDYWKYLEAADDSLYGICFRSAAQRAEAFLRTLNLWKD